jgi:hypothetical protein
LQPGPFDVLEARVGHDAPQLILVGFVLLALEGGDGLSFFRQVRDL